MPKKPNTYALLTQRHEQLWEAKWTPAMRLSMWQGVFELNADSVCQRRIAF